MVHRGTETQRFFDYDYDDDYDDDDDLKRDEGRRTKDEVTMT